MEYTFKIFNHSTIFHKNELCAKISRNRKNAKFTMEILLDTTNKLEIYLRHKNGHICYPSIQFHSSLFLCNNNKFILKKMKRIIENAIFHVDPYFKEDFSEDFENIRHIVPTVPNIEIIKNILIQSNGL